MSPSKISSARAELDQLVRRQRSKLTAQLVNRCGYHLLPLIEDAIQDAIVKALEKWEYDGLPDNAPAWLYRVAYNRANDLLRRSAPEIDYEVAFNSRLSNDQLEADEIDAELKLLLYCCHPELTPIEQQILMLNLVIGLDYTELANLTLTTKQAIAQRLARLKRKTRSSNQFRSGQRLEWHGESIGSLIAAIYTAFNLGYFPRLGESLIRRDVAFEALRLGQVISNQYSASDQQGRLLALVALMSFQCSRLSARGNSLDEPLLLQDQNPNHWDPHLIQQGHQMLILAKQSNGISEFHVEAAIAAIHSSKNADTNW